MESIKSLPHQAVDEKATLGDEQDATARGTPTPHATPPTPARHTPVHPTDMPRRLTPGLTPRGVCDGVECGTMRRWSASTFRGCSLMVEHELPKLRARVRFSSPAPRESPRPAAGGFFVVWTSSGTSCHIHARHLAAQRVEALRAESIGRVLEPVSEAIARPVARAEIHRNRHAQQRQRDLLAHSSLSNPPNCTRGPAFMHNNRGITDLSATLGHTALKIDRATAACDPFRIGGLGRRGGCGHVGADLCSALRVKSLRHLPVDAEDQRSYRLRTEM